MQPQTWPELGQSRQLLYELLVQAPCPIAVVRGPDLMFEMANRRFADACGGQSPVGRSLLDALPELRGQGFDAVLLKVLATGEDFVGEGVPVKLSRTSLGTPRESHWNIAYTPLRTSDGALDRVMIAAFDVTEQELARKERDRYIDELRHTLQLSELIMGALGHDLRTPLSAVLMTARMLSRSHEGDSLRDGLGLIVQSAERMSRMIDQLLDFTRVRLGKGVHLYLETLDVGELCASIIAELEAVYGRAIGLIERGSLIGRYDRVRLSQLLSNLGANACQHGTPGTPITIQADGSTSSAITIEVQNRGVIPAELLPLLFEPFRAGGHDQAKKPHEGLGLGLFIGHQIVLAHGGDMRVESDPERGTHFVVTLPRESAR